MKKRLLNQVFQRSSLSLTEKAFWRLSVSAMRFNIEIDFKRFSTIFLLHLRFLTSVPPDPVLTTDCRHWVDLLTDATGQANSAVPAKGSVLQSCTLRFQLP